MIYLFAGADGHPVPLIIYDDGLCRRWLLSHAKSDRDALMIGQGEEEPRQRDLRNDWELQQAFDSSIALDGSLGAYVVLCTETSDLN